MNRTTHPSYHEELAAHLDGQAAPLPHPNTHQHGYKGREQSGDLILSRAQAKLALSQAKLIEARLRHMGIDPEMPGHFSVAASSLGARGKISQAKINAASRPAGPENETEGADELIKGSRTGGRLLVAYFVLATIAVVFGLVRGCAS